MHYGVDKFNLDKRGRYDIITALPPKSTTANVIDTLKKKLPTRAASSIEDGSGKNYPVYIILPKGYLTTE